MCVYSILAKHWVLAGHALWTESWEVGEGERGGGGGLSLGLSKMKGNRAVPLSTTTRCNTSLKNSNNLYTW